MESEPAIGFSLIALLMTMKHPRTLSKRYTLEARDEVLAYLLSVSSVSVGV